MTRGLLTRLLPVAAAAVLLFTGSVVTLHADPIRVTSGFFVQPDEGANQFEFFGDGFTLTGFLVPMPISPRFECERAGCRPGTRISMSAVAGGDLAGGSLGFAAEAIVNGTVFLPLRGPGGVMTGTLRFDAPERVLPSSGGVTAPFDLSGQVNVFARDDLDPTPPLFTIDLVGRGTVRLAFDPKLIDNPETTFIFRADPPVPEPATVILSPRGSPEWLRGRGGANEQHRFVGLDAAIGACIRLH